MLARLTVHFPLRPTRSFLLEGGSESVIGRDESCDIVLDDDRVSRRHARLSGAGADWRLLDLDSTNGTSLEGKPLREAVLQEAGWISFGGLLARFERSSLDRESEEAHLRRERAATSVSLQRRLDPSLGLSRLLDRLLDSVLQLSGATRGAVLLRGEDGDLAVAARRDVEDETFTASAGALERAAATGRAVAVSDVLADPGLRTRESVIAAGVRALVCLPLLAFERPIGLIYADSRTPGASFGELDVEILEALAAHAALAIVMARVDEELKLLAARLPAAASDLARARAHLSGGGESA